MSMRRTAASIAGFTALAASITTAALVTSSSDPAGATELAQFSSCAELGAWTQDTIAGGAGVTGSADTRVMADSEGAPVPSGAAGGADEAAASLEQSLDGDLGATGGTNTVVSGVDEIDVIDRVGEDRLLVARNGALALVDLDGRTVLDEVLDMPFDARISVDGDRVWIVGTATPSVTSHGGTSATVVHRMSVAGDELVAGEQWTTPGSVLDARRTGDRLHLVVVDYPQGAGDIAFDGGPVPCDQVWRPVEPATDPAATMVVTLGADGPLEPLAATEVVGAGSNILVTGESVYVATVTWTGDAGADVSTGVHRFDLATLTPTGSGAVPGMVAGPFALDEHEGTLRVATNLQQFFGRPMPLIEGADEPAPTSADAPATPVELAEVFVLDTDGDLDLVGRTGLFGHDGETIHGVRFVGDTAYVVTFLNTDPFWVLDLADPAAPAIVGELQIPGFSAYLHPVGDTRVVGFGPDGSGQIAARLFDVADPAAPAVLDEVALGEDSPVVWDHKAYVGLAEGRFAVPVNDYPDVVEERCAPSDQPVPLPEPLPVDPGIGDGSGGGSGGGGAVGDDGVTSSPSPLVPPETQVCEPVFSGGESGVVVLTVDGDTLATVARQAVPSDGSLSAERAVPIPDGSWLLLAYDRLVPTDGGDPVPLPADDSPGGGGPIVID